ncbi:MAG TPA: phosphate ABC transporter permease PstA [Acidimicrobiales bacterium]|nr:phosphate ABC transporter permease PstA [Acidimicrobiales bacterium]
MTAPYEPVPVSVLGRSRPGVRTRNTGFKMLLLACIGTGIVALAVLLVYVVTKGAPRLNLDLIQRFPSSLPRRAGARSAIFGTIWVVGLTALFCLPVGVGAAVYLEEFADRDRWWNRLIEVNIQNLAAVPSIVYGILGLGFLVRGPGGLGFTVLAAALTLTLLVFPIVVIASREAIRAVPNSIRLGALALGATPLQAVRTQVLPAAVPGIATGSILALSRAIGEAAPLLLVGAYSFITFNPSGPDSAFTVLPVQIFNWISRPQAEFEVLAAAASVVLVGILLLMNSVAIWLRNRYQRKW